MGWSEYVDYLIGERLSQKTIKRYVRWVRDADEWLQRQGNNLGEATASEIREWSEERVTNSHSSRGQAAAALRHYWNCIERDRAPVKAIRVVHQTGPKRVQMNIAHQLKKIGILLAEDRLVAILKQVPLAIMTQVEADCMACHQSSHDPGKGSSAGSQEQVKVVGQQRPGVTGRARLFENDPQSLQKRSSVLLIPEDRCSANTPGDNVVKRPRRVYSWLSWHNGGTLAGRWGSVKLIC